MKESEGCEKRPHGNRRSDDSVTFVSRKTEGEKKDEHEGDRQPN